MKLEKFNYSSGKRGRWFLYGVICTVVLMVLLNLFLSKAKYYNTESIPIVKGTIKNYSPTDFKLLAIKLENENQEYENSETIPSNGYALNTESSYCTVPNENGTEEKDTNILISYHDGVIDFENVNKRNTKCYLYFDIFKEINYTMLYYYGNEYEEITGGWVRHGYNCGSLSKNADNIVGYGAVNTNAQKLVNSFGTDIPVDISSYSGLHYLVTTQNYEYYWNSNTIGGAANYLYWTWWAAGIAETKHAASYCGTSMTQTNPPVSGNLYSVLNQKRLLTVDITSLSGNMYPVVAFNAYTYHVNEVPSIKMEVVVLTKEDDYLSLAALVGIEATTISDVLSQSELLLSNEDAVKYMIHNCTGDFMVNAVRNETFMNALNTSEYKDLVYENEHWSKFLSMVS